MICRPSDSFPSPDVFHGVPRGDPSILMNIRAETFSIFSRERDGVTTLLISKKPLSHSALLTAMVSTACLSFRRDLIYGYPPSNPYNFTLTPEILNPNF